MKNSPQSEENKSINDNFKKEWISPKFEKLSFRDTQSGIHLTESERAKTDVYGGS